MPRLQCWIGPHYFVVVSGSSAIYNHGNRSFADWRSVLGLPCELVGLRVRLAFCFDLAESVAALSAQRFHVHSSSHTVAGLALIHFLQSPFVSATRMQAETPRKQV